MNSSRSKQCPVCSSTSVEIFFEMDDVPVHCNVLRPTYTAALNAPCGKMQLGYCSTCGHLYNYAFDSALTRYTEAYENSLHFSPRFQRYAEELASELVTCYNLHHKTVIEIGCGKGDFLRLICKLGKNHGIGFDTSYLPETTAAESKEQFTVIQDFYSEKYSHYDADFICCRHVLEHIQSPRSFIATIRSSIGTRQQCGLYVEVPNALYMLRDVGIWDLIYEHCSYFTPVSLSRLFASSGFAVERLDEKFDGQFLGIEVLPSVSNTIFEPSTKNDLEEIKKHVDVFAANYRTKVEQWKQLLTQSNNERQRVVVWGGGSKGITFLNVLKKYSHIEYTVDINPRKLGMFTPGSGQRIVPPEFLREYSPDVIIIMNSIYKDEIQGNVAAMGLSAELIIV